MGSWSEACGFSGMEIGEGEVAYCLLMKQHNGSLNDGAFHHYVPVTTLLRGTYNDYGYLNVEEDEGVLAVFNEQAQLNLKNGDNFSADHLVGKAGIHRWWMHGAAFDFMPTIRPDFPYASTTDDEGKYKSVPIENVGEAQGVFFENAKRRIDRLIELDRENEGADSAVLKAIGRMRMAEVFGYRASPLDRDKLIEEMIAGAGQPRLDAYRRITTLGWALGELRKPLAPCESTGPQHGGEEASLQFANFLIEAQEARATRWLS